MPLKRGQWCICWGTIFSCGSIRNCCCSSKCFYNASVYENLETCHIANETYLFISNCLSVLDPSSTVQPLSSLSLSQLFPFRRSSPWLQLWWYDCISTGLFCLPLEFRNSSCGGIYGSESTTRTTVRPWGSVHLMSVLESGRQSSLHWDQTREDTGKNCYPSEGGLHEWVDGENLSWVSSLRFVVIISWTL